MACATTASDDGNFLRRYDTRKKRKNIRGAKVGTLIATTTSSTIKVQNKKLTFGVGGK